MILTIAQVAAWISAGQSLIGAGVAVASQVRGWIQSSHPAMSETDLNALLDAIIVGATRHKALADADAGKP